MDNGIKHIYTIPAGLPFARILASSLLEQTREAPEQLSRLTILLPTRRACRVLQEAFVNLQKGQALLLPRLQPIGDLEDDDLVLNIAGYDNGLSLPSLLPAMPPLQRQIILSRLVRAKDPNGSPEQALALAKALGHLMDQIYTENLSLADITKLAPANFADHWQITIEFLKILSEEWPKILRDKNMIDLADRRNRLILGLSDFWEQHPPTYPVIAAGSTGSIPATARLLSVIAGLPQGKIILPGYDSDLDPQSWEALEETHTQYGFKILLQQMNAERLCVKPWPHDDFITPAHTARQYLSREIMRPSTTSSHWMSLATDLAAQQKISQACANLSILNCKNENEEATTIALLIREALETPEKTVCLITPDRNLAARVQSACRRWGLAIDDSAGQSLERTPLGQFFALIAQAFHSDFAPLPLLALLKHKFCILNLETPARETGIQNIDLALRGLKPAKGLEGLRRHIQNHENLSDAAKDSALNVVHALSTAFEPLQSTQNTSFERTLKAHLNVCENCAQSLESPEKSLLWSGAEGQAAALFFSNLLTIEDLKLFDDIPLKTHYEELFLHLIKHIPVRPAFGTHPRVQILGQLEARLMDADLVILGGLNEGLWPPDSGADPWMSRPMRQSFGLPSLERSIGLAAHDFVQAFCNPQIVITRSEKIGNAISIPARWLQRLNAVMEAAKLQNLLTLNPAAPLAWARTLDYRHATPRAPRPAPCPPLDKRPKRLSVTRIETWIKDPYAIYARSILKLEKLKNIEHPMDNAAHGDLLHKILETFMTQYPHDLPLDMSSTLRAIANQALLRYDQDESLWQFWWPKFNRIATWLETHETEWRKNAVNIGNEVRGEMPIKTALGTFTLSGYADRIDRHDCGGGAIIDYKSGGNFSFSAMKSGDLPQLPLEALILSTGGFSALGALKPRSLQYWILNGRGEGGQCKNLEDDIDEILETTDNGLRALIEAYENPAMPYLSLPRPDKIPRFNDYEHLARVQEWTITGEDAEMESEP